MCFMYSSIIATCILNPHNDIWMNELMRMRDAKYNGPLLQQVGVAYDSCAMPTEAWAHLNM